MGEPSVPAFIDRFDDGSAPKRLVVVNRTEPDPVQRLLETALGDQVGVAEDSRPAADDDLVVLLSGDDVLASSPLRAVMDSFLLINSDAYRTGDWGVEEPRLPDVLANLDGEVLHLRGYPASNTEKLLLIAVSRAIEARALAAGTGRLDAAFQRIDRMDDEYGTREVYERLAASGVEVHAYGASGGEWVRQQGIDVEPHTAEEERYRRAWFVVYTPDEEGGEGEGNGEEESGRPAALVCWETGRNVWKGAWTYDPDQVAAFRRYLAESF